ncbi:MAG: FAD-dependent oxidoreductase [Gammaproteobacteria bacterium]|uniref:FAD-dependent oxidoreductase n=1 Tax=Candidatus Thiopontia autotrophica TaxID=2841688 RepID=A0A8J6P9I5_9GAMM|nr:FAD-dependent oxidoreductase [Candidatus Thiopontia autotrophica]MBL6968681.1 FAD-dependent oxidoreductase [Gammaproteobacteria bacterium]
MSKFNRRDFLKVSGGAVGAATIATSGLSFANTNLDSRGRVVVVGGGLGGATAAKYIKRADASIDVTIIEPNKTYYTGFTSNLTLTGMVTMDQLGHTYEGLTAMGIKVVHDSVTEIGDKAVKTAGGGSYGFDRCVVSPGVDFKFVDGHSEEVANKSVTHAYKSGHQMNLLGEQIRGMKDGGTVVIAAPRNPFRCPPGPYERTSQIASYLKTHNPKSKIIVLDPKGKFSKFGLFREAWNIHYGFDPAADGSNDGSIIEWRKMTPLEEIDAATNTAITEVDEVKGDVLNVIPDQKAGHVAHVNGLVDGDWCPVNLQTFESKKRANIHVIGDSSAAKGLPKSGYAAASEAKVTAAAIVAALNGNSAPIPAYTNTCYSVVAPNDAFSVAAVYQLAADHSKVMKVSGGLTPSGKNRNPAHREREVAYALSWYENITTDAFSDGKKL